MAKKIFSFIVPVKGDSVGEVIRKILSFVAFVVLVVCAVNLFSYYYNGYLNDNKNKNLADLYHSQSSSSVSSSSATSSSKYPEGMLPSFYSIYDINPDIKAWIKIPNMKNIDLGIFQTSNNEFYLDHTFDRQPNSLGALFMDYRDSVNPMSKNLIVYGHNMKDGQMFHDLRYFQEADTYSKSSLISFNTIYGEYNWKVFATFPANTETSQGYVFDYLKTDFASDTDFMSFITEVQARSLFKTSVDVQASDHIITLSTCAYDFENERLVVMARMVRPGESNDIGPVSVNRNAVDPMEPMPSK
jgi:sortase, SrtB family